MILDSKFHHIGIAVISIQKAKPFYEKAGYTISDIIKEPKQKVNVAYASKEGCPLLELLEPLNDSSPICSIIKKQGCTPYHICYSVHDIDKAISELKQNGYILLEKPVPGHGLNDALVCFLYNKNIGLIQLVQL